jgi:UDP-2,3-diacylglucosamine pyrophosphatase LpxH
MRRLIVSDLHMSIADRLDDFDADDEFVEFITTYAMGSGPTELILAGDTIEFLQVRLSEINDYDWSEDAAVIRLRAVIQAHPKVFEALRTFVAQPDNQLTILIGNHDFELHYSAAKQLLYETLSLAYDDPRLRFGITYEGGGIYIEHGNQFDEWNRFIHFEGISAPFEVVRGTRVVKDVINMLEEDSLEVAPLIDNVKPTSAFFWYLLSLSRLRDPAVRRYVARGLIRLFRSEALPLSYHTKPMLRVREELLGAPGQTLERELALQTLYDADPELRKVVAASHGGVEPQIQLRRRFIGHTAALGKTLSRYLYNEGEPTDQALAQIEDEAKQQLRLEIRQFRNALQRGMAIRASEAAHRHNTVFVCGHSHLAEVVPFNERQTYYNIGTWTLIIQDITTNRYQAQRFPFLEVWYPDDSDIPQAQLLVWRNANEKPKPWVSSTETKE